jgi:GntR family transcriptional regulator
VVAALAAQTGEGASGWRRKRARGRKRVAAQTGEGAKERALRRNPGDISRGDSQQMHDHLQQGPSDSAVEDVRRHEQELRDRTRSTRIKEERRYNALIRERARGEGAEKQHSSLRVYGLIKSAIRIGVLGPEEKLLEPDLVRTYAASRGAVREALGQLADEGLVTREPRHGTVVRRSISSLSLQDGAVWRVVPPEGRSDASLTPSFGPAGDEQLDLDVVYAEHATVPTSPLLRERLQTTDAHMRMSEYVLTYEGRPFELHTAYSRLGTARRRLQIEDCASGDLAKTFEHAYGCPLHRVETSIEAVSCDQRTAKLLDLPLGFPMLWRERLLVGVDEQQREYSFTAYVGRRIALQSSVVVTPER